MGEAMKQRSSHLIPGPSPYGEGSKCRSAIGVDEVKKYFIETIKIDSMAFRQTMKIKYTRSTNCWSVALAFLLTAFCVLTCGETVAQQNLTLSQAIEVAQR